MPVRTKSEIETQITQLLPDNTTGMISAADVRSVFTDLIDSLAFLTEVPPEPGDHTRRTAISPNSNLSVAEVTAGESSDSQFVDTPDWDDGEFMYLFVGVPEDENDISDIKSGGVSVFLSYEAHEDAQDDPIIVSGFKWWRTVDTQDGEFGANQTLEVVQ